LPPQPTANAAVSKRVAPLRTIAAGLTVIIGLLACDSQPPPPIPAGYGIASQDQNLLSRPRPGLSPEQRLEWSVGRSFAIQPWVTAPTTTTARDGLGPLYNANSCAACHRHNLGGQLPEHGPGLILRLNSPGPQQNKNVAAHSKLGIQLQDRALPGIKPEGRINWREQRHQAAEHTLLYRQYGITAPSNKHSVSARLAPALIGQGLIDSVSDDVLIALADPEDNNGDGISGRVNKVWDPQQNRYRPGKFGWKAGQASLKQQIALAFAQDLGIRSSLFPHAICPANSNCLKTDSEPLEINDKLLEAVSFYIANLAVPAPTQISKSLPAPANQASQTLTSRQSQALTSEQITALPGYRVFTTLGCNSCHRQFMQGRNANGDTVNFQIFSDLLLHDMGEALADTVEEFSASGKEWRTAPLWGLGLKTNKADNSRLLHDGRAKNIHQAILWHGGEAQQSQDSYRAISAFQQQQLLQFLQAL
jgi:CxxC motif-containing protein (DUF1111 family)